MLDIAAFIDETSTHLARSREAARRHDTDALRAAVLALGAASEEAGAARMAALCGRLQHSVAADECRTLDPLIDALAAEFHRVSRAVQSLSRAR
jgi:HPt (histidine-containing phosphotransfer) domain-containing protein